METTTTRAGHGLAERVNMTTTTEPTTDELRAELAATVEHRQTAKGGQKTAATRKIKQLVRQLNDAGVEGDADSILAPVEAPAAKPAKKGPSVPRDDDGRILRLFDGSFTTRGSGLSVDSFTYHGTDEASPVRLARGCVVDVGNGAMSISKRKGDELSLVPYGNESAEPVKAQLAAVVSIATSIKIG